MVTQTVYDVGDPLTSRLNLGVDPDGTTNVAITVYKPDGTVLSPAPALSVWQNVREKVAQWFATDDGFQGSPTTTAAGDWVAIWTITGAGANRVAKVYNVRAMPTARADRPGWAPFLSDVAAYVPTLTVDTLTPGGGLLGTFNGRTTPDDGQAHLHLDAAVDSLVARFGTLPAGTERLARSVAAMKAAASLARAWLRTDDRLAAARDLEALAATETTALGEAVADVADSTPPGTRPLPQYAFPTASPYGDLNL